MAKSRSIGGIYASLSLRDAGFKKGLAAAQSHLASFGSATLKALPVVGVAAAALTTAMAAGTKGAFSMAGTLDDASVNTGIAIADMMLLRKSYELGGVAASGASKDIAKLQKALVDADGGGQNPFESLGLSVTELLKQNPAKQFALIGEAIMQIQNPAERAAKTMEIFGKSGASLINVFGQVEDAAQFLGKMPGIMQDYAGAMARADDLIGELPTKSEQFFAGFSSGIIGELLPALEKLNAHDFTELGQKLGNSLSQGIRFFDSDLPWQILQLRGYAATAKLAGGMANLLSAGINTGIDQGIEHLERKFGHLGTFLSDVFVQATGTDEVKARWADIMSRDVQAANLDQGFSPLGGGAPAIDINPISEIFSKYLKEGNLGLFGDTIKELEESADSLAAILNDNLAKGMATIKAMSTQREGTTGESGMADIMGAALDKMKAFEPGNFISPVRMEVNEYQRRGLSLDGATQSDPKQDKQVELLQSIDQTLKKDRAHRGATF